MTESIYSQAEQLLNHVAPTLQRQGQTMALPGQGITLSHYEVRDTALAACLATLGIPFRQPAPFTEDIALSKSDSVDAHRLCWWLAASSPGEEDVAHKTETIAGYWEFPLRLQAEQPLHPLNAMRDALDAREWWVAVIHGREPIAGEPKPGTRFFATHSLHAACILKAIGYQPLAFNGRAFFLQMELAGVPAEQVIETAAQPEGATPQQWMSRVLLNYSQLLSIAKSRQPILRRKYGQQTLLLTADSTTKNRDKFLGLLNLARR